MPTGMQETLQWQHLTELLLLRNLTSGETPTGAGHTGPQGDIYQVFIVAEYM